MMSNPEEQGMEKYGTDITQLPVTEDQMAEMEKIASAEGKPMPKPKNFAEAADWLLLHKVKIAEEPSDE